MRRSIFATIVSALILAGCSVHSPELRPSIDIPSSYSGSEAETSPQIGRWWEKFDDERLNLLMQETFRHNLDITQAYARLEQLQSVAGITAASGGLNLNITGSASRNRQGDSGFSKASTFNTYSLSAAASYELDLWRRLGSAAEAARLDALASEEDLKSLYISISAQLADLYFFAVEQRAQIELSDRTISSFKETLALVERRYRGGLVPAIDLYQSRQNLTSAKAQRPIF